MEKYFSIRVDNEIVEKVFKDAKDDHVTEKNYLIFQSKKSLFKSKLKVIGSVDEYEPETICIEIQNIQNKDLNHFKNRIEN